MRLTRLTALRTAILVAVGFVVVRVLYRIVFGGADGPGMLLLDLPRVRLSGPFEHITLLGPVTSGGVALIVWSAVPFALLVLAFGLLAVVFDLRALAARGAVRGPVRTISRALVVAWGAVPALVGSVARVRTARHLRGERGVASLLVPVLEQGVERAIALGSAMEVRGFAATRRAEPECERPATVRSASLGYDGSWSLVDLDLDVAPGTLTVVTGATGSGKSTLLDALSGLFQHVAGGEQQGIVEVAGVNRALVPPRETAGFVGVVAQSVRLSFVAATVREELGFALANRDVAAVIVTARVEETARRLGIQHLLTRSTVALSAGEACLVAIGAALIEHPVLLLVDEPLADLDDSARVTVIDLLDELAHQAGVAVVVAEHAIRGWGDRADAWLEVRDGTVIRRSGAELALRDSARTQPRHADLGPAPVSAAPIAEIRDLTVTHGDEVAVAGASLHLCGGEVVALRGPNGARKSSLLIATALPTQRGDVFVDGCDVHAVGRRERPSYVALVPEQFDDLFFSTSVEAECRRADRRGNAGATAQLFAELLDADHDRASDLASRHPRDLSAGERLCLALAIQLTAHPRVILIDEPSRGLDAAARALVGRAIVAAATRGAAVLMATHDEDFAATYSTRTIRMAAGRIEPVAVTS